MAEYDWMPEARQITAQCWCDAETSHLTMDPVLAEAVARRIAGWMQIGAQHAGNEEFWRNQCRQSTPFAENAPPQKSERDYMVHVCPVKDIVCGNNPANWCDQCPLIPNIAVEGMPAQPHNANDRELAYQFGMQASQIAREHDPSMIAARWWMNPDYPGNLLVEVIRLCRQHFHKG